MREAQLESLFRRCVKRAGGASYKLAPTHVGMPDRIVLWPGGHVEFVELKTAVGRLRPAQLEWHHRAAALGTVVTVLYGADGVRSWSRERKDR